MLFQLLFKKWLRIDLKITHLMIAFEKPLNLIII